MATPVRKILFALAGLLAVRWCVPAYGMTPEEGLRRIAEDATQRFGAYSSRKSSYLINGWPYTLSRLVIVEQAGIPILQEPNLGSPMLRVVGVTRTGEVFPVLEERRVRVLFENPLGGPSSNGMWYRVRLLNGEEGWIFAHPDGARPIASAIKNPSYDPALIARDKAEAEQRRLEAFRTSLKPVHVGKKTFLVARHVRLSNKEIADGTVFDLVGMTDRTVTLVMPGGRIETYNRLSPWGSPWADVADFNWDIANDQATGLDPPSDVFRRYYHGFTSMFYAAASTHFAGFFALVGAFTVYIVLVRLARRDFLPPKSMLWWLVRNAVLAFVLLLILGIFEEQSYHDHAAFLASIDAFNANILPSLRTPSGHILPHTNSPYMASDWGGTVTNVFYIPLLIGFHIYFLWTLPTFVKAVHYLVVPHRAAEVIRAALRPANRPPINIALFLDALRLRTRSLFIPTFVHTHWARKSEALKARVQADRELMEEVERHQRMRAKLHE